MALGMEVSLSPGDFVLDGDPAPSPKRGRRPPSQFSAHFYCGQTAGCIKMPLGMEVGLTGGDFIFDGGLSSPSAKRGKRPSPIFGPCLLWPNGWMDQDGTWHRGGPWSRPHCTKGVEPPHFPANFYCGQTARCIKMPLGMEVGFGLRDTVLDGDPAPPPLQGHSPHPIFRPMRCGQMAGCRMD